MTPRDPKIPKTADAGTKPWWKLGIVIAVANRRTRYPIAYAWLLVISALDIILTWIILGKGGREVNPRAREVIDDWGLDGMIAYKFGLILFFRKPYRPYKA